MPRAYHSASSHGLGQRCERAWFYQYVKGLRDPEIKWRDVAHYKAAAKRDSRGIIWWSDPASRIEPPADPFAPWAPGAPIKSRQRSTALGTAVHSVIESWYHHVPQIDWGTLPGQIALSGLHHLPDPDKCHLVGVEKPLGSVQIVDKYGGKLALVVDEIAWVGSRDLVANAPGEFLRMGVDVPDGWMLLDHKSSRDLKRYAKTAAELHGDFQANLYAYATCKELGIDEIPAGWVYYETQDKRRAMRVDTMISKASAYEAVCIASERSKHLDTLEREQDAQPNTDACTAYGGCPYHASAGGPCRAERSLRSLISAHTLVRKNKEIPHMALTPEQQAKFAAFAGALPAPAPAPSPAQPEAPAPAAEALALAPVDAPPPPPAAAKPKTRKVKLAAVEPAQPEIPPLDVSPPAAATFPSALADHPEGGLVATFSKSFTIPGDFGSLIVTLEGDPRDVCEGITRILGC